MGVPEWIHHELVNWSRWCWLGPYPHPLPPEHAGSIEWRYENPSDLYRDAPEPKPPPVMHERARVVQAAWERLEPTQKAVIRAEYPARHASGRIEFGRSGAARRLGLSLDQYEAALFAGAMRIGEAF